MPDYQKGKIYKLWSPSKNLIYYGSTVETLASRLAKHKSHYKKHNDDNTKTNYIASFLILDCEDYKMELLENYPCNNRQQLERKEGEYIKNNECVNKVIAGRTDLEYRLDNVNKLKEQCRIYKSNNANILKEKAKQYYKDNADTIKEKVSKYRSDNADKIKEQKRQYRLKKNLEKESSTTD